MSEKEQNTRRGRMMADSQARSLVSAIECTLSLARAMQDAGGVVHEDILDLTMREFLSLAASNGVRFIYQKPEEQDLLGPDLKEIFKQAGKDAAAVNKRIHEVVAKADLTPVKMSHGTSTIDAFSGWCEVSGSNGSAYIYLVIVGEKRYQAWVESRGEGRHRWDWYLPNTHQNGWSEDLEVARQHASAELNLMVRKAIV